MDRYVKHADYVNIVLQCTMHHSTRDTSNYQQRIEIGDSRLLTALHGTLYYTLRRPSQNPTPQTLNPQTPQALNPEVSSFRPLHPLRALKSAQAWHHGGASSARRVAAFVASAPGRPSEALVGTYEPYVILQPEGR